ncbi:glycine-rich protein-like [Magnolia sinica]|uniref:glycine-rich protein-like n=1 Tax=Magnolia sinica TaxID=86752 RepID=UPI00265A7C8D|nr:glycine-rich protein-like [Magnolia sinica]
MASKSTILVLGVILAVFLLISSDVAARELAEDTTKESTKVETGGGKQHRGGGYTRRSETVYCLHSCCSEGIGGCQRCCSGGGVVQSQPHN